MSVLLVIVATLAVIGVASVGLAYFMGGDRVLALLIGPPERPEIEFESLQKTWKPNQYLACPPELCEETPDRAAPAFPVTPERLKATWMTVVAAMPRTELYRESDDGMQQDWVQYSEMVRFPDTVTVRFLPTDGGSTLAVYSRSHYGVRDFGVNQDRVDFWLAAVARKIGQ